LQEALRHFENIKRNDTELLDLYRQAAFLEAMCHEQLGDFDRAQEEYYSLTRIFPGTAEAVGSQFRWGYIELLIKDNRAGGLAAIARFFEMLDRQETYANSWMPITDIANVGLDEIQNLIDARQYDKAEEMLDYFHSIVPEERQAKLYSGIYSQWGEQLESLTEGKKNDEKQDLIRQAREKFRLAGKWYEELAQWTFNAPDYLNNVWDSAANYERGRDFLKALAMYRLYLEQEFVLRQAQTHYRIGNILFEMNEIDAAVKELEYGITNYPDDLVAEPARLILARAYQEKKQWDTAARLLKLNLDGQYGPNSDVFRDSLYELGRVYDRMYDNAATLAVFEEVLVLYPGDPKTAEAHYMIAKANLNEEENLNAQIDEADLPSQANTLRNVPSETQRRALDHLKQARVILLRQEEQYGLDKADERMLRNAYFMIGRILSTMGPEYYGESLQENKTAVARYQGHPDVLQAYLQLARVSQLQGEPEQATRTATQAQNLLQQFVAAKAFRQETVYTEKQWQELLGMP
jgi:tetratricopeptide (TPR) repeat protein